MSLIQNLITAIQDVIAFIEKIDPNATNNPVLQELQKILAILQAL